MDANGKDRLVLVRMAGELFIKSRRTRSAFLRRLRGNLKDALDSAGTDATLEQGWDRIYVRGPEDAVLRFPGRESPGWRFRPRE